MVGVEQTKSSLVKHHSSRGAIRATPPSTECTPSSPTVHPPPPGCLGHWGCNQVIHRFNFLAPASADVSSAGLCTEPGQHSPHLWAPMPITTQ